MGEAPSTERLVVVPVTGEGLAEAAVATVGAAVPTLTLVNVAVFIDAVVHAVLARPM